MKLYTHSHTYTPQQEQGCYACARRQLSNRAAIQSLEQSCQACVRCSKAVCHVISVALSILVYNYWGGWRSVDWKGFLAAVAVLSFAPPS